MTWGQTLTITAVLIAANILLWNIRSEISNVRTDMERENAAIRVEMTNSFAGISKDIANVHSAVSETHSAIAGLRTEMIRETTQNRSEINLIQGQISNASQ